MRIYDHNTHIDLRYGNIDVVLTTQFPLPAAHGVVPWQGVEDDAARGWVTRRCR